MAVGIPVVAFVYLWALTPSIAILLWLLFGLGDYSGFAFSFSCPTADICDNAWQTFNWHPFLMTVAFLTLFSQAIVSFKLLPIPHMKAKLVHFSIQTLGMICSIIGFIIIVTFKIKTDNYNFYTAHSYLGLLGIVFFIIQYTVGFISFLFPKLPDKPRATVHSFHIFAGFCIYVLTLTAIFTGIADRQLIGGWGGYGMSTSVYSYSWIGANLVLIFGITVAISVFWVHRPPTNRALYAKQHKDTLDEDLPILQ